ncbi:TlpA family protein disulfide reductase [Cryobacterium psychrophilum]|uniref:Redoxin domain-containing protein n=1 Tax=Cryobacterium psychrophilum TaxID=41988 RepID=A0A4Y8KMT9_9MICO|nr:TlpA family protein disulfide reductase [Cryobacterium psychrophilum]TDW30387.1 thiol-disulfide isomerase/thioredoxin [Cryobacterium psychrophilum]TFD79077.1 redoxin domain-containing protein [Cryobacterium psychrophilum]
MRAGSRSPRPARLLAVSGLVAAALVLSGCASDSLADQYREGSNKGFIAGDGSVTEINASARGEAIDFAGVGENGETLSSSDFTGEVLVVNFWYASCAPCRAEAADLQKLNAQFTDKGAAFLGVNVRDQAANATAFNDTYGITYPSVLDVDDGSMQLAFSGSIPPNAVPTTLVLDQQGRVAARILGQVTSPSILETLIRDTVAEGS